MHVEFTELTESERFAQELLGTPARDPQSQQELAAFVSEICADRRSESRAAVDQEALAASELAQSEWLADISTVHEAQWDPAKHPRGAFPENRGWFSPTPGSGSAEKPASFTDAIRKRNAAVHELTGVMTPGMVRSSRLATELQSAGRLPAETSRAAAAGLRTGSKAVVNGSATAIKNVATLGLSDSQLELIAVTDEDRANGYDTAVAIATASGEVLIAVGTGGVASALSKGGTVARTASGSLVAFDAAGNAVGVVQGTYDAAKNGVNVRNGAQIAGGALGLGANVAAAAAVGGSAGKWGRNRGYMVAKHGDMPSPRPGKHSHHGVMSEWMRRHFPGYDENKAPAILMSKKNHHDTYGVYNQWRGTTTRSHGGRFDWNKVSEGDIRNLSEKMFDKAKVPHSLRKEYWDEFERMKVAIRKQQSAKRIRESIMGASLGILDAEQMRALYKSFYRRGAHHHLDRTKVPRPLWPLIPYAEFWGIADDWTRQDLVKDAPLEVQQNLKQVVENYDPEFNHWLAGPEAEHPPFSDEYIAFTTLRMAADFVL